MLDEDNSDHQKSNAKIIHSIVEAVDRSNAFIQQFNKIIFTISKGRIMIIFGER